MSTPNENEPVTSAAPADPGPPEWLKAANAANPPKRSLFPKSTIGQSPRSSIGVPAVSVPTEPASAQPAPVEPTLAEPALTEPALAEPALTEPASAEPAPVQRASSTTSPHSPRVPPVAPGPPSAPAYTRPDVPSTPSLPAASTTPYPAPAGGSSPAPNLSVYATTPTSASKGLSLASLILGCSGLVLTVFYLGLFPAIAAVIVGHIARRRQPASKALWLTGLITGYLALAISVFLGGWIVLIFIQAFTTPLG
jgi:hypothetical protein